MTLADLRAAIIADLQTRLSQNVKVEGHGGRFSADELQRYGAKAPTVLVAILGLGELTASGSTVDASVACAALVVTSDRPSLPRDLGALAIVTTLAPALPGNAFALDVSGATNVRADNLYSAQVDKLGVALWALTWRQPGVTLNALDPAALDDFLMLHVDYDAAAGVSDDLCLGLPDGYQYLTYNGHKVFDAAGNPILIPEA